MRIIKLLYITLFFSTALSAFAESAPVYDVDSVGQDQYVMGNDSPDYPPPPPSQGQESAFIPLQPTIVSAAPSQHLSAEQRIRRMEQQINNMQTSDSVTKVDSLQDQVQVLRNQIEVLTHQLEQLQNQQKSMFSDLDKRLGQAGLAPTPATPVSDLSTSVAAVEEAIPKPVVIKTGKKWGKNKKNDTTAPTLTSLEGKPMVAVTQPNLAEEQHIYQTAYNLIKAKKYNEAVTALQGMLKRYPSGQFASNAHYWLGELYGLMGKNTQALNEFRAVVHSYPDSPRVSDAQLKVGLILASESQWQEAKLALRQVVIHYPNSASARLASEQLRQIKQAGH